MASSSGVRAGAGVCQVPQELVGQGLHSLSLRRKRGRHGGRVPLGAPLDVGSGGSHGPAASSAAVAGPGHLPHSSRGQELQLLPCCPWPSLFLRCPSPFSRLLHGSYSQLSPSSRLWALTGGDPEVGGAPQKVGCVFVLPFKHLLATSPLKWLLTHAGASPL